jgi:RNA polymerase sigma factor (sigma-70 family)
VREAHARSRTTAANSVATMDGAVDLARDRELVEACQSGDETAFAELYSRYHRRLLRFCLRRLHATDDAEEAVQEAFTRAWRALPRFGGDRRFYPWLSVIAGNVCTDMLRRRSRLVSLDEMPSRRADGAVEADVDEGLLRQVDLAMASEALGHLSDRHQRVLRLREATEWTSQRIAEHEGVAVPAVDTLLWRARQAFKREFAALSDTGGLAAALGFGVVALRRAVGRVGSRMAALAAVPPRSPGTLVATVAITGAAVAGGGFALIGSSSPPGASPLASAAAASSAPASAFPTAASAPSGASDLAAHAGRAISGSAMAGVPTTKASTAAPAPTTASGGSAGGSALTGGATLATLGGQSPVGRRLAAAGSVAVNSVGQVVGSGVAVVSGVLGLAHQAVPPVPGSTSGGGGSTSGSGSTPVTVGSGVGTVTTAATTIAGAVTTTVGSVTKGLLGTSA